MKIFNKYMEKCLEKNPCFVNENDAIISIVLGFISSFFIIGYTKGTIIGDTYKINIDFQLIFLSYVYCCLTTFVWLVIFSKKNQYKYNRMMSSNPILRKLKEISSPKDCVNLIELWNEYKSTKGNKDDISLFQKLDNDLTYFIENADNTTLKLFNLSDFESYKKLYVKYMAKKQKERIIEKIQDLLFELPFTRKYEENPLINNLNELKNEVEQFSYDDVLEFRKHNKEMINSLNLLMFDKETDFDVIKSNYQDFMEKINNSY